MTGTFQLEDIVHYPTPPDYMDGYSTASMIGTVSNGMAFIWRGDDETPLHPDVTYSCPGIPNCLYQASTDFPQPAEWATGARRSTFGGDEWRNVAPGDDPTRGDEGVPPTCWFGYEGAAVRIR
jgi:hypothetical protein